MGWKISCIQKSTCHFLVHDVQLHFDPSHGSILPPNGTQVYHFWKVKAKLPSIIFWNCSERLRLRHFPPRAWPSRFLMLMDSSLFDLLPLELVALIQDRVPQLQLCEVGTRTGHPPSAHTSHKDDWECMLLRLLTPWRCPITALNFGKLVRWNNLRSKFVNRNVQQNKLN